jgi:protein involved in plasmid replication-relaxation
VAAVPASYLEAHRYDGAAIEHGHRERLEHCALQPRDVAIVRDVWRYKYLTAPQLRELWWPGASVQACDRRLLKLFRAGHLDRFRPYARPGTGSYPWTYHLGEEGHRLLQHTGDIPDRQRYRLRPLFDYGRVLHDIQLNAWVLAYRRALGNALLAWDGETTIEPPSGLRREQERFDDDWSPEGLNDDRPRSVCPDAVLEIAGDQPGASSRLIFVEYDRTRRLDKNYDKFHRYDAFLTWWWIHTAIGNRQAPPFVLFVCQDHEQRDLFLKAADHQLRGHRWHPDVSPDRYAYVGRQRILIATEIDAHAAVLEARGVPRFPIGHESRRPGTRRVRIALAADQMERFVGGPDPGGHNDRNRKAA